MNRFVARALSKKSTDAVRWLQRRAAICAWLAPLTLTSIWVVAVDTSGVPSVTPLGPSAAPEIPVRRNVQYVFTIQNERKDVIERSQLWVAVPLTRSSSQNRIALRASRSCETITDSCGNQVLHFTFTNLPPYAVKVVSVEADLEMNAVSVDQGVASNRFLRPEPMLPFDGEEFVKLAPSFSPGEPHAVASNICGWVGANIARGGYAARPRGALSALKERKGDCTEFADLFVALCRRAGIPARTMGGYVCPKNAVLGPKGYHNWAEFHDGRAWRVADPYRRLFDPQTPEYVAFQIVGDEDGPLKGFPRYRFEGEGLQVRMN